jgi:hypothetical protein
VPTDAAGTRLGLFTRRAAATLLAAGAVVAGGAAGVGAAGEGRCRRCCGVAQRTLALLVERGQCPKKSYITQLAAEHMAEENETSTLLKDPPGMPESPEVFKADDPRLGALLEAEGLRSDKKMIDALVQHCVPTFAFGPLYAKNEILANARLVQTRLQNEERAEFSDSKEKVDVIDTDEEKVDVIDTEAVREFLNNHDWFAAEQLTREEHQAKLEQSTLVVKAVEEKLALLHQQVDEAQAAAEKAINKFVRVANKAAAYAGESDDRKAEPQSRARKVQSAGNAERDEVGLSALAAHDTIVVSGKAMIAAAEREKAELMEGADRWQSRQLDLIAAAKRKADAEREADADREAGAKSARGAGGSAGGSA